LILIKITYQAITLLGIPKIPTDTLWDITVFFIIVGLIYFAFIFYFRNKLLARKKRVLSKKKELTPMISEFLFHDESDSKKEKSRYLELKVQIREMLKDKFHRQVMTETLLDLEKDLSGSTHTQLCQLYSNLGLQDDAIEKLKSWRWKIVAGAISELTRMQVKAAYPHVSKFINDKRTIIRKQAEIATVTLKKDGINYFLDTTRLKISEWQQLKLLDAIRDLENFNPPKFKAWLTSKNKHVVLFALRLIKYYHQNDANTAIVTLLNHRNNTIKTEAIHCIREFNIVRAIPVLKGIYWQCNTDIKLQLIDTIAKVGDTRHINFLEGVSKKEKDFVLKSKAISAINTIAPHTILPTEGIHPSAIDKIALEENDSPSVVPLHQEVAEKAAIGKSDFPQETPFALNLDTIALEEQDEGLWEVCINDQLHEILEEHKLNNNLSEDQDASFDFLPIVSDDTEIKKKSLANSYTEDEVSFVSMAFLPLVKDDEAYFKSLRFRNEQEVLNIKVVYQIIHGDTARTQIDPILDNTTATNDNELLAIDNDIEVIDPKVIIGSTIKDLGVTPIDLEDLVPNFIPKAYTSISVIDEEVVSSAKFSETNESVVDSPVFKGGEQPIIPEEVSNHDALYVSNLLQSLHFRLPQSVFGKLYFNKDDYSKRLLLDTINDVGDQREIPLLKKIIHQEKNLDIREEALEVLNNLSDKDFKICSGNLILSKIQSCDSIFKHLMDTSDRDSKILLIEEMAKVGDKKEQLFLKELTSHKSIKIREKAKESLKHLQARLPELEPLTATDEAEENTTKDNPIVPIQANNRIEIEHKKTDARIPLEFFLLQPDSQISAMEELKSKEADNVKGLSVFSKFSIKQYFIRGNKTNG